MSLRQLNLLKKPMLPVPMLPRMLRPCVSLLSRGQRSPTFQTIQEAKITKASAIQEAKATHSAAIRDAETQRASQAELLQRQHGKVMQDLEEWVVQQESNCQSDFLSACQAALHTSLVGLKGVLVASYQLLLGQAHTSHSFSLLPKISLMEKQPAPAAPPAPMPKQSPRPKRWHASPDPVDSKPPSRTMPQTAPEEPPKSQRQELPPWNKALKQSCSEAFSWDLDLVQEAREEYFSKHSYNFIMEGTHNHSEIFRWMATSTELLGTSIYEIQVVWTGLDELRQANYALRSLPKGPKFLHTVPPSESPKVMGLVGIHDPDTLCHFNGMTHWSWCGKEGQNKGTVVNHLWTVHYRLGLKCNKCNNCPSTSSDTLCCHGQQDCQKPGEKVPNEPVSSE